MNAAAQRNQKLLKGQEKNKGPLASRLSRLKRELSRKLSFHSEGLNMRVQMGHGLTVVFDAEDWEMTEIGEEWPGAARSEATS